MFVAINLLTPRETQYYWQKPPGVATVWLCFTSDMRFTRIHHSIVRRVLKETVQGRLIIHESSRYTSLLSTAEVSNHYKKLICKNVRCYLWALLTQNNESIKTLSGPDRRLLNRTWPQKSVKTWISSWASLIKDCTKVTTTVKYNSCTASHCSFQFELWWSKSVYTVYEEHEIVCINRFAARGRTPFVARLIECIHSLCLTNFRGFEA